MQLRQHAILLLAVFVVGGLFSPLAHRISHVHAVEHTHGRAADAFMGTSAGTLNLLVEERTPFHELQCDLCARLSADAADRDVLPAVHQHLSELRPSTDLVWSDRSGTSGRIRAPPAG